MNSECDQILELLPSLALGVLEADARERVAAHLAHCERCRSEAGDYEAVVVQLGLGAPRVAPPDALKQRLMRRIQAPVRPRVRRPFAWFSRLLFGWPRLAPIGLLAGAALTLILGLSNYYLWRQVRTSGPGSGLESVNLVHLRPTDAAPGASGTLLMAKDGAWSMLVVQGLPALDAERQYQLWLIADGRRTSGGVFSVSAQGEAQLKVSSPRPMAGYEAFGITIEPRGGSPGPTGDKVLGGRLARTDA
ncbi:MAG: anti-sigma factor [Desulfobacterales bacterium]|nr:anti-sigma factor [Desulfobacterales bacterium]